MTLLQLRTRGRHRTGVNARVLIARHAVTAPVCPCGSVNLSDRCDPSFGELYRCEDCGAYLDTTGVRL